MLIPYSTDAPVYHAPIATVSIIGINCVVFFFGGDCEQILAGDLILQFDRINPLQWWTAAFLHGSWCHLFGNMIFLWSFGLIVEGKLGWARFSALYFVLAGCDGAASQVPMYLLGGEGGALGSSGVVFALMMIALIWAPANEINCLLQGYWFFVWYIDIPILYFAGFFLSMEVLQLVLMGWHMSTPMLHLLGASVGIPIGLFLLIRGHVDCEGWDLLTRWSGAGTQHDITMRRSLVQKIFGQRAFQLVAQEEQRQRVQQMEGRDALEHILANPDAYNPPHAKRKSAAGSSSRDRRTDLRAADQRTVRRTPVR